MNSYPHNSHILVDFFAYGFMEVVPSFLFLFIIPRSSKKKHVITSDTNNPPVTSLLRDTKSMMTETISKITSNIGSKNHPYTPIPDR
jgi:hypothetical protein